MTALRVKEEHRVILDFSHGKYSKNKIKHLLQNCQVSVFEEEDENTIVENDIKVGMYTVQLHLSFIRLLGKLKQFGDFEVSIFDCNGHSIDLKKDGRFQDQYWVSSNSSRQLRIKHLVDIISHCKRLDRLRVYL